MTLPIKDKWILNFNTSNCDRFWNYSIINNPHHSCRMIKSPEFWTLYVPFIGIRLRRLRKSRSGVGVYPVRLNPPASWKNELWRAGPKQPAYGGTVNLNHGRLWLLLEEKGNPFAWGLINPPIKGFNLFCILQLRNVYRHFILAETIYSHGIFREIIP